MLSLQEKSEVTSDLVPHVVSTETESSKSLEMAWHQCFRLENWDIRGYEALDVLKVPHLPLANVFPCSYVIISKWSHQTPSHPCWNPRFFLPYPSVSPIALLNIFLFFFSQPLSTVQILFSNHVPLCPSCTLLPVMLVIKESSSSSWS